MYEGKSLTLLKGVLRHSFIYTRIFHHEVEITRLELVFTSFAASLFPPPPRALISRPVGACFQIYQQNIIKGIFFFYEIKKIIVRSHLKKTLEEKVPKLCLLPSNFMRETKVVEAHLKRTMSMESSWNRETSNTWELCYRR